MSVFSIFVRRGWDAGGQRNGDKERRDGMERETSSAVREKEDEDESRQLERVGQFSETRPNHHKRK